MLDINRLENVKKGTSRISAKCPACAIEGSDNKGTNLSIVTSTGAFTCAKYPGASGHEHRREIFRLVGIRGERDPIAEREWRQARAKTAAIELSRRQLSRAVLAKRAAIILKRKIEISPKRRK
jgi:hypothetical protein